MSGIYGSDAARHFTNFADKFLKGLFEFMPPVASWLGLHEYDGRTPDLSPEAIDDRIEVLYDAIAEMDAIDPGGFDPEMRLDYDLLYQGISAERFRLAEQRELT